MRAALELGLSWYGAHLTTVVPYSLGFVLCFCLTAAGLIRLGTPDAAVRRLRNAVGVVTTLMLPVPLTPYSIDSIFDWLHLGAVAILFAAGYGLGTWLALGVAHNRYASGIFALQTVAAASIVAAQFGLNDYTIVSELGYQVTLVALVAHGIRNYAIPPTHRSATWRHPGGSARGRSNGAEFPAA